MTTPQSSVPSPPNGKTLVTGASGHVGASLVRHLLAAGEDVRVLVHPRHNNRGVEGLPVERVEGDLLDADSVARAAKGCVRVYHTAAKVSVLSPTEPQMRELWQINVLGTRNVLRAAQRAGVARVVHTSSFSTIGFDPDDPRKACHEDMPFYPFVEWMPYSRTKVLAEHEVLQACADGLDVVIAVSTGVVGPYDYLPSRTGKAMIDFSRGKLRAIIPGGYEAVTTEDLARGHVLAMERGRTGQRYIFSTRYVTMDEMVALFAEQIGTDRRPIALSPRLMSAVARTISKPMARLFPNVPQHLTPGAVFVLTMQRRADTTKAQQELGFVPGDLPAAVRAWHRFFVDEGMIAR
ncbi:NAD-dependent epimerase/dehydratase family protein [Nannocystis bainbridge]|uniref:NAD-dependent epimerase/dehydratase family protein n=1 Tax=Nannocystis bainbridge TaxID=2995303 RepID=A0ABT5EAJ0_9BACT|nr:NAD-dependent epimerase/dehydratase family protein [Nannocystis bainbridge]MDC0722364.1 NAD-dependent epimerase/dehydratase family protein [Nannocystis bainbridge]